MTHVIALMTAKGGSGKTTLARGLLSAADARGLRVAFVDTDKTTNTYAWAVHAAGLGLWNDAIEAYQITDAHEVEELVGEIRDEAELDLVVVDTPGDASAVHEAMLGSADLILCPLTMTKGAVDTALRTACWHHRQMRKIADPLDIARFAAVINGVVARPARPYAEQIRRVRSELLVGDDLDSPTARLPVLDTVVRWRTAYGEMEAKGLLDRVIAAKSPAERLNIPHLTAAQAEMHALLDECLTVMSVGEQMAALEAAE